MARVNVDEKSATDPRITRAARKIGEARACTLGRLVEVWRACHHARSAVLAEEDVDAAGQLDGLGSVLVDTCLADRTEVGLRIRGVADTIAYLERQAEFGKRRHNRSGLAEGSRLTSCGDPQPSSSSSSSSSSPLRGDTEEGRLAGSPTTCLTNSETSQTPPQLQLVSGPALRPQPAKKSAARVKPALPVASQEEMGVVDRVLGRLSEVTGRHYQVCRTHTELILARLREGVDEWDLRALIRSRADAWGCPPLPGKQDMRPFLRPETLFGPETIHKYLPEARALRADIEKREGPLGAAPVLRQGAMR